MLLSNIPALGNELLQRPLSGALNRVASQNQMYFAKMPNLAEMSQEKRAEDKRNPPPTDKQKKRKNILTKPGDLVDIAKDQPQSTLLNRPLYG